MIALALAAGLVVAPLQVPYLAQQRDTCGPSALAMVLRFWGRSADPVALATALGAAELRGVAGSRLAAAARAQGLQAVAYRGDLVHLRQQLERGRPVIVAWDMEKDRAHNVVVVGFEDDDPVVHDPALGAFRRIERKLFEKRWEGVGNWSLLVVPQ